MPMRLNVAWPNTVPQQMSVLTCRGHKWAPEMMVNALRVQKLCNKTNHEALTCLQACLCLRIASAFVTMLITNITTLHAQNFQHFHGVASYSAGKASAQVSLVASDIASVLERFASGSSFSEQSHGGGRESNSYLLPYLVQLGRYLASCCSANDRQVYCVC